MLASYLAKARGSGEPEFSRLRARELDTFVREVEAWTMDKGPLFASSSLDPHSHVYGSGHSIGSEFDNQINMFRVRFEQIIKTEGEDSTSGTSFGATTGGGQTNPKAMEKV